MNWIIKEALALAVEQGGRQPAYAVLANVEGEEEIDQH